MAALDDLGAWLQNLSDSQYAAGVASCQDEIDSLTAQVADVQASNAASAVQIATLTSQLAAFQAKYDAYVAAHPDAAPLPVFTVRDFAVQSSGWYWGPKSMTTRGRYSMVPFSSTKSTPTSGTNLNRLMRGGSSVSTSQPTGLEYANFVLEGTDQGHEFGGFLLQYCIGAYLHDFAISGCPGSSSSPPGEIALLDLLHSIDTRIANVTLDGRRVSDGAQVGSTLFEHNKTTGPSHTADNLVMQYAQFGFCAAMDLSSADITYTNCYFGHSRKANNIEHSMGGSVHYRGCRFDDIWGAAYIAQVSSIVSGGKSCKVTFEDCIFPTKLAQVRTWPSTTNNQLDSDIRRIENGQDVSDDPTRFQIVHLG